MKSRHQKFCKQIPLFYTFRSVYGREPGLRTYSIDVPDDRHTDGDRRDIQVILIERTTISWRLTNSTFLICVIWTPCGWQNEVVHVYKKKNLYIHIYIYYTYMIAFDANHWTRSVERPGHKRLKEREKKKEKQEERKKANNRYFGFVRSCP